MCFYEESEWYASIVEDETKPAAKPTKCDECRRIIQIGDPVRHIFMKEREVCRHDPESDDYDPEDTGEPDCNEECKHDFGESFECDQCETCTQLIEAIHQHEIESGCSEDESRPGLTGLYDAFAEGEGAAYLAKAEALYPGIAARMPDSFLKAAARSDDASLARQWPPWS